MSQLPSSIESYLSEAGFSATELMIIKRLMTDDAVTLRHMAARTGKSTGVLDQSTRKLLNKGIIRKETINDNPRFVLASLNAIVLWVQEDMKEKRETLLRKYQNFETFIANLTFDRTRPEMKYYEGYEGLKQAYTKLLAQKQEIIGFIPALFNESEDPLREFRVEYFRERRHRGIFQRAFTHNSPLGRRYESRDHFEYRKTLLVSETEYPFLTEKLVSGDIILHVDYAKERACFITHPELAQNERVFFETLWRETLCKQEGRSKEQCDKDTPKPMEVPLATRAGSNVREFFLGRSSLVALGIFAIAAGLMTYGLYRHNVQQNTERIREQARAIAIAAAPRFDGEDLDQLHTIEDITKPEYTKVIKTLNEIRWEQNNVRYSYILRQTEEHRWEFVADADSMDPSARIDLNQDGQINDADDLNYPSDPLGTWSQSMETLAQGKPYVDSEPYRDQWGIWISGGAPIFRSDGSIAGAVGVDIDASEISRMTAKTFSPLLYIVLLFLIFFAVRFSAANKALVKEILTVLHQRKILIAITASLVLSAAATFGLQQYTSSLNLKRIQDRVQSIAITGSALLNPEDVAALQVEEDWKKPEWANVVNTLKDIRLMNEDIAFVYLLRQSPDAQNAVFVTDSHSLNPFANTDDDPTNDVDANNDGKIEPDGPDKLQWPGQIYDTAPQEAIDAYDKPSVSKPYEDLWGAYISGYAPVKERDGTVVGVLAVDVRTGKLMELNHNSLQPIQYFVGLGLAFFVLILSLLNPQFLKAITKKLSNRKFVIGCSAAAVVVSGALYGLHVHGERLEKELMGERLMTIAATAASQFDPEDLNQLRKAGDMKTEAYQRVFKKLNEIKDGNPEITYAYIMRPTDTPDVWEFVADADSNFDVPFWSDINNDGILTAEDDEIVWPGQQYVSTETNYMRDTLKKPNYNLGNQDQWGYFISGSAPIFDAKKQVVAIIEISILYESQ